MPARARLVGKVALMALSVRTLPAQGLADLCRAAGDAQVGQWASYDVTGGPHPGQLRLAIVGSERVGDSTFRWLEIRYTSNDPAHNTVVQLLLFGVGDGATSARGMVMQTDTQPAVKMSGQMMAMMGRQVAQTIGTLQWSKYCASASVVGWESVTAPLGTIHALHVKSETGDAWATHEVPFALVRMSANNGTETVLIGYGTDAKSSINQQPREMREIMITDP